MSQNEKQRFESILNVLTTRLKLILYQISDDDLSTLQEIRLRSEKPVVIVKNGGSYFINDKCVLTKLYSSSSVKITAQEVADTLNRICNYSFHSNQQNINNGFVTIAGGHRAGLCGTAVQAGDGNYNVKDISYINIRFARQVFGASEIITEKLFKEKVCSIVIAGEPSCGKTTLLRDLSYRISSGYTGEYIKTAVIDERGEFSGSYSGVAQFDLGLNTDILINYDKPTAVELSLRSLSPEYIVFDEICSEEDLKAIYKGINSGVSFAVSIHCGDENELKQKSIMTSLLKTGAFKYVVLLDGKNAPCSIKRIFRITYENDEVHWSVFNSDM